MFKKQFELLERAVNRISEQLKTADNEQKIYLAEELFELQKTCDSYLEKWIEFEDHVSELVERYRLDQIAQHANQLGTQVKTSVNSAYENKGSQDDSSAMFGYKTLASRTIANQKPSVAIDLKPYELVSANLQVRNFQKGVGFFNLLMFPEAITEFQQVIAGNGQHFVLARLYLGISCLMQKRHEEARQQFKILEHMTRDANVLSIVYQSRACLDFEEGDFANALRFFQKAYELSPDQKDLDFNLGVCFARLGKYVQALQCFVKSYRTDPLDLDAGLLCAKLWRLLGYLEEAYLYVNELGKTFPDRTAILALQAELLLELGDLEFAEQSFQKLIEKDPLYGRGYSGLGWIRLLREDLMQAKGYFLKHLSLEPDNCEAKFHIAWVLAQQGELKKAEHLLVEILKAQPGDPYALIGLADVYGRIGEHPSARDLLHRVAKNKNPHLKRIALVHLGKLSLEQKRYDESLRYLNAALRFDNTSVETLFYKGLTYYLLGDQTSAEQYWQRCGGRLPDLLAQ
jgi:tetratricopeptide (TPR) repeat protein